MTKNELAFELKNRLRTKKLVEEEILDIVPDDDIITSYITCVCYVEKQVNLEQLEYAIEQAKNAEDFFSICDRVSQYNCKH